MANVRSMIAPNWMVLLLNSVWTILAAGTTMVSATQEILKKWNKVDGGAARKSGKPLLVVFPEM